MSLTDFRDWSVVVGSIFSFIGIIVLVYRTFTDPDKIAEKSLTVLNTSCVLKHNRIDEIIKEIREGIAGVNYTFAHFKENEFNHIEAEMRRISEVQTKILTILEERNK